MEGIYSITKDGEKIGTLKVGRQGGYTVFEADCHVMPGLLRLSVYGQDREGYLGVLMPQQGRMLLKKKLSPSAMRDFPQIIELVGPAGGMERKTESSVEMKEECVWEKGEKEECSPDKNEEKCPKAEEETQLSTDEDGPFWYASPDGALVSSDGCREMVALPLGDDRTPKNIPGECRVIEGKEYLVYITKELG